MEQQILTELTTIKYLLWIILFLIVAFVIYFLSRTVVGNLSQIDAIKRNQFLSIAQALEDQGKYSELKAEAQTRMNKYPKDVLAWWYYALAQYKSNELGGALSSFSELRSIDPAWQKEAVDEYVQEIRSAMKGPDSVNT